MDTEVILASLFSGGGLLVGAAGLGFGVYQLRLRRRAEQRALELQITGSISLRPRGGTSDCPERYVVSVPVLITNRATRANAVTGCLLEITRPEGSDFLNVATPSRRGRSGPWIDGDLRVSDDALGLPIDLGAREAIGGTLHFISELGGPVDVKTCRFGLLLLDIDSRPTIELLQQE